jgi:hypothetical protein
LADKSLPETLDPRIVENAALHRRITELEAQVDDLTSQRDSARDEADWLRRMLCKTPWYQEGFRQSQQMAAQAAQQAFANAQNYQAGTQGQLNSWHDCTCVPGRAAAFGVLGG